MKGGRALPALALLGALLGTPPALAQGAPVHDTKTAEPGGIVARYLLMDPAGRAVSNEDFRGRFQLVTFGYTQCPDVCPTTLAEMAEILRLLGEQAARLQPLFVTVDPARDSAAVLRGYTEFFDPRIVGLTGSPALIRRVADNFKVKYEKVREPDAAPNHYWMDHSAGMFLLGPDGGFVAKFAYATPAADIAGRIREFMDDPAAQRFEQK